MQSIIYTTALFCRLRRNGIWDSKAVEQPFAKRAEELISVAHPDFRSELKKEAKRLLQKRD
jgi:hypothetical protein